VITCLVKGNHSLSAGECRFLDCRGWSASSPCDLDERLGLDSNATACFYSAEERHVKSMFRQWCVDPAFLHSAAGTLHLNSGYGCFHRCPGRCRRPVRVFVLHAASVWILYDLLTPDGIMGLSNDAHAGAKISCCTALGRLVASNRQRAVAVILVPRAQAIGRLFVLGQKPVYASVALERDGRLSTCSPAPGKTYVPLPVPHTSPNRRLWSSC